VKVLFSKVSVFIFNSHSFQQINGSLQGLVIANKYIKFTASYDSTYHMTTGTVDLKLDGYTAVAISMGHTGNHETYPFRYQLTDDKLYYGFKSIRNSGNVDSYVCVTYVANEFVKK